MHKESVIHTYNCELCESILAKSKNTKLESIVFKLRGLPWDILGYFDFNTVVTEDINSLQEETEQEMWDRWAVTILTTFTTNNKAIFFF